MDIKKYRVEKDWSRAKTVIELNKIGLDITTETLRSWELGSTSPDVKDVKFLSQVYGVDVCEMIKG